jgi:hypothetical protein
LARLNICNLVPLGDREYHRIGFTLTKRVAAVDTSIIPFYTQMYVPVWGGCSSDIGGGVFGRMIDLGYSDDNYVPWHRGTVYFLWLPPQTSADDSPLSALDVRLHASMGSTEKSLGQNFYWMNLHSKSRRCPSYDQDVVLEIGAGLGSLTRHLAVSARSVIAVELDSNLITPLNHVVRLLTNVHVIEGDILALDTAELVSHESYLVVANIPYYITSALIRHLLEAELPPTRLVLTIQREVARRICATPGDLSLLALSVQVYGHPKIINHIPANAFYPPPKVD